MSTTTGDRLNILIASKPTFSYVLYIDSFRKLKIVNENVTHLDLLTQQSRRILIYPENNMQHGNSKGFNTVDVIKRDV